MNQSVAFQRIWGVLLVAMGISLLFRIPSVMDNIVSSGQLSSGLGFFRFCLYFVSVILMGGGIKKLMGKTKSDD